MARRPQEGWLNARTGELMVLREGEGHEFAMLPRWQRAHRGRLILKGDELFRWAFSKGWVRYDYEFERLLIQLDLFLFSVAFAAGSVKDAERALEYFVQQHPHGKALIDIPRVGSTVALWCDRVVKLFKAGGKRYRKALKGLVHTLVVGHEQARR